MGYKYEITTTAAELKHDEALIKYLLLDGLRSQAEIHRIGAQKRQLGRELFSTYRLGDRTAAEKERQSQDREIIESLVRKYGRQIILTEASASQPAEDPIRGAYRAVDFDDAVVAIDTPAGTEEIPYADMKLDSANGMTYRLAYAVSLPHKVWLTPAEYKQNSFHLPQAPPLPT